jgi:arginine exporter protein ArgO
MHVHIVNRVSAWSQLEQWAMCTFIVKQGIRKSYLLGHMSAALYSALQYFLMCIVVLHVKLQFQRKTTVNLSDFQTP